MNCQFIVLDKNSIACPTSDAFDTLVKRWDTSLYKFINGKSWNFSSKFIELTVETISDGIRTKNGSPEVLSQPSRSLWVGWTEHLL